MTEVSEWTESLPPLWEAKPLKSVATYSVSNVDKVPADGELPVSLCNYTNVYNNEFINLGIDFMQTTATEDELRKFGLVVDDVVITKDSESWDDIAIPALITETAANLVCGYHLAMLRPLSDRLYGRYLFRCLQAKVIRVPLELASTGVTRFGLPKDEIGKLLLPIPPLKQQHAIADYLDCETAKIDALVAVKEQLLVILNEKRRAIITHAATHGLDSKAPLRDSGIPWLGQIPRHWGIIRLKHFADIYYGLSQPPEYKPDGIAFVRATNVKRGQLVRDGLVFVDDADMPDTRVVRLQAGDIIVVRSGAYTGDSAIVTAEWTGTIAGYDMVARIHRYAMPDFIAFAMLCQYVLEAQIDPCRLRAAQPHLNAEELGDVGFAIPPITEQQAIIAYIQNETSKIDALRGAAERTISLLKERRAALIAAAVTGKIEVKPSGLRKA